MIGKIVKYIVGEIIKYVIILEFSIVEVEN